MRGRIVRSVMFGAAMIVAACAGRVQEPEVRLSGVRLGGLGLEGGLIYAQLNVMNPNRFDIRAGGLRYDLDLADPRAEEDEWVDLAEGTFEERIYIPANDSAVVEIPIQFTFAGANAVLRSILDMGSVQYRVSGVVAVSDPLRTDIPFSRRGVVSLAGSR